VGDCFYGSPGFETISAALRKGNDLAVRGALMLYVNPGSSVEQGLRRRRLAEVDMFDGKKSPF
jgi:lysozyme